MTPSILGLYPGNPLLTFVHLHGPDFHSMATSSTNALPQFCIYLNKATLQGFCFKGPYSGKGVQLGLV